MAANQATSGSLLSWNTVPAVSESCFLQRSHWNTLRVLSAQKPRWPQAGQVSPSRQRIWNKASRHAASVPKRSRNAASLRPRTARRNPSADAIPPPSPALEPARILDRIGMGVMDNQVKERHDISQGIAVFSSTHQRAGGLSNMELRHLWIEM